MCYLSAITRQRNIRMGNNVSFSTRVRGEPRTGESEDDSEYQRTGVRRGPSSLRNPSRAIFRRRNRGYFLRRGHLTVFGEFSLSGSRNFAQFLAAGDHGSGLAAGSFNYLERYREQGLFRRDGGDYNNGDKTRAPISENEAIIKVGQPRCRQLVGE